MAEKEKAVVPVFDKDDLIKAGPTVFNVSPEIMVGALYDVTEALTMDQAKAKVKEYLERPING